MSRDHDLIAQTRAEPGVADLRPFGSHPPACVAFKLAVSKLRIHWLYDEVDVDERQPGHFLHRVLLSDGRVLEVPFISVIIRRVPLSPSAGGEVSRTSARAVLVFLLGERTPSSEILQGERKIGLNHVRKIAEITTGQGGVSRWRWRFGIDAEGADEAAAAFRRASVGLREAQGATVANHPSSAASTCNVALVRPTAPATTRLTPRELISRLLRRRICVVRFPSPSFSLSISERQKRLPFLLFGEPCRRGRGTFSRTTARATPEAPGSVDVGAVIFFLVDVLLRAGNINS